MHFPIPQLATLLLLAHSVLGCCWHHAHACADDCCEEPAPVSVSCACSGHGNDRPHSDGAPSQNERHDGHNCQGQRCSFIRVDNSPAAVSLHALGDGMLWITPTPPLPLGRSRPGHLCFVGQNDSGTSLRAHLVFGVLLI